MWDCTIDSLNQTLINILKIVTRANEPKELRTNICKGNLGHYVGKFICYKNLSFTNNHQLWRWCIGKTVDYLSEGWWFETTCFYRLFSER